MARVLLVVWEAADWSLCRRLIDQGRMPRLAQLVGAGAAGRLNATPPREPWCLLTSLATGKAAADHGICASHEIAAGTVRPVTSHSLEASTVWQIAASQGRTAGALNWPMTWPVIADGTAVEISEPVFRPLRREGRMRAAPPDSVAPASWREALEALRLHAADVHAEALLAFVPDAARVDQDRDDLLATVAVKLAETATLQNIADWCLRRRTWDLLALRFSALDLVARRFGPLMPSGGEVDAAEPVRVERYGDVLPRFLELHDLMLGHLVDLAGEDCTVMLVSPAGLRFDRLSGREPVRERYRSEGFLAACGPGVRSDGRLLGASVLDVVPTILRLLGLSEGADMPGRPLSEVFELAGGPTRIRTWDSGRLEPSGDADPDLVEAFLAEYHSPRPPSAPEQFEELTLERVVNRARSLSVTGRSSQALEELLALRDLDCRNNPDYHRILAHLLIDHGRDEGITALISAMMRAGGSDFEHDVLQARLHSLRGEHEAALERLFASLARCPGHVMLHVYIGEEYRRLGRGVDALEAFGNALRMDPGHLRARLGQAHVLLEQNRYRAAADAAMAAVERHFAAAKAHELLGRALEAMGEWQSAADAYSASLRFDPLRVESHRALARLFDSDRLDQPQLRDAHRQRYARTLAQSTLAAND